MYSDTHVHTAFSSDSTEAVIKQIDRAADLGMPALCITDHQDIDFPAEVYGDDFRFDTEEYFKLLSSLREEYKGRIDLRIGVELGLKDDIPKKLEEYVKSYNFDYVIGSIHLVRNMDPYYDEFFEGRTPQDAYFEYFETVLANVRMHSCFDSLGHLDYVVRYGPAPGEGYPNRRFSEITDEILKTIIEKGIALECNTAGLKYGLGFPNPHKDVIKRYVELGGEMVTLGSDAHMTKHLGYAFSEIGSFLRECGLKSLTEFVGRKPVFVDL